MKLRLTIAGMFLMFVPLIAQAQFRDLDVAMSNLTRGFGSGDVQAIVSGIGSEDQVMLQFPGLVDQSSTFFGRDQAAYLLDGLFNRVKPSGFELQSATKKSAEGQARHALMLLFGLDSYIKFAVAVDADVDVYDDDDVLWAMATRFQADTDMFMVPKVFCNRLDPSAVDGMSAKLGIDATAPLDWDVQRTALPPAAVEWARQFLDRS